MSRAATTWTESVRIKRTDPASTPTLLQRPSFPILEQTTRPRMRWYTSSWLHGPTAIRRSLTDEMKLSSSQTTAVDRQAPFSRLTKPGPLPVSLLQGPGGLGDDAVHLFHTSDHCPFGRGRFSTYGWRCFTVGTDEQDRNTR